MAHDVFISYASADKAIADAVCARLEEHTIRCWIAPRDIRPGADWASSIVSAISEARALVLVFSAKANASREIPREVSQAVKHGLSIITFRIEDVAPAGALDYSLNTVHWLDAVTPPVDRHIDRLAETLRTLLDQPAAPAADTGATIQAQSPLLARCAALFAVTALALPLAPGGSGAAAIFVEFGGAVFFVLALSVLVLHDWSQRIIASVLAMPIYYGAVMLALMTDDDLPWTLNFALGGAAGAVVVTLVLAVWQRGLLRAVGYAAGAGALAGLAFVLFHVRGRGGIGSGYIGGHVIWQVLVGCTLVAYTRLRQGSMHLPRTTPWRPLLVTAALSVAWIPATARMSRVAAAGIATGARETHPVDGLSYSWVPPGEFRMGCSQTDSECNADESPQLWDVRISNGFWLGNTEVTVEAWRKVMGQMPGAALFLGRDLNPGWSGTNMPVVNVTWGEAVRYCEAVSGRLPTEAEWEYAARAGGTEARYGKVHEVAWFAGNSGAQWLETESIRGDAYSQALATNGNRPHEVDGLSSNPWGLADMLGNVGEWVTDDYGDRTYAALAEQRARPGAAAKIVDPLHTTGLSSGNQKVVRGGSWFQPARSVRASNRLAMAADSRSTDIGFRCVWNRPAGAASR
jgi:formylglycine-generating enzyme required for sulfatase activity